VREREREYLSHIQYSKSNRTHTEILISTFEGGENYIMNSFIIYAVHQMFIRSRRTRWAEHVVCMWGYGRCGKRLHKRPWHGGEYNIV
jgi:hypothetical protein